MGTRGTNGTTITFDGKPTYYQGLSFFNALYNPTFSRSDEERRKWLLYLRSWGITALRVWGDWRTTNGWIDEGAELSSATEDLFHGLIWKPLTIKPRAGANAC